METTDYCSYELSKALKACGFDEPCDHYYTPNKALHIVKSNALAPEITNNRFLDEIGDGCCTAVPLWQAQKWLREVKRCDVTVYAQPYNGLPYYTGYILFEGDETEVLDDNGQWFDDYEKALSETIAAALELIKKGE